MTDLWSHNTERRIYVDCDGVLADFDTHFEDHIGLKSSHYESTHGSKRFWETIQHEFDQFFYHLPKMPDAVELMSILKSYGFRPIILTGCPRGDWSRVQKLKWGEKHFPGIPMITCISANKRDYCHPGDVLIDDMLTHRQKWVDAGGVYIHHTSAKNSIMLLQEEGIIDTFGL
jgi:hypothetical protein